MKKRFLSLLLCLVMVVTLLPSMSLTASAADYPDGTILIPLDTNGIPASTNGTGWTYDSVSNTLTLNSGNSYAVDGECNAIVNNSGTIVGGTYNNTVNNIGDSDTTYKEAIAVIDAGVFNGEVINGDGYDICTINSGTFNGAVTNKNRGIINNGTFNGEITNMLGSTVNGGTFVVEFELNSGIWVTGYTAPANYTYADGLVLPSAENISNGTLSFDGWYDNAEFSGIPTTAIPAESFGKLRFYARFVDGIPTWEAAGNLAAENTDYTIDEDGNYTVLTAKGIAKIANIVNGGDPLSGKTVTLANDIDLLNGGVNQYAKESITERNSWIPIDGFAGTFDGNEKKIENLYVLTTNEDAGLFGSNAGTVKDLEIVSGEVTLNVTGNSEYHVGGIAASASGQIDNCVNRAAIYVNDTKGYGVVYAGGIAGLVSTSVGGATVSTVSNCVNYGKVSSLGSSSCGISGGGIAGYHVSGRITGKKTLITQCTNEGTISINPGSGGWAGGIAGTVKSNSNSDTSITATVTNCKNSGYVGSNMAGGITGYNTNAAYVYNCYNTGSITGDTNAGGIVGLNYYSNATVANCYSTGSVSNAANTGGIVGNYISGNIANCYYLNTAATKAAGKIASGKTLTDCAEFTTAETSHTLASAVYGTTDLLTALKEWVAAQNTTNYLSWIADVQNSNYPVFAPATYTVSFDSKGGSDVASQAIVDGQTAVKPANPTRGGYTFAGWYSDEICTASYDFDNAVTADITLYAKWNVVHNNPTYTPTVEDTTGGNTTVSDKNPEKGDKVTITTNPDEGYVVGEVVVTDQNGKAVAVTDNGDGTYTYVQPAGKVTITVTYVCDGTHTCPSLVYSDLDVTKWYHLSADYVISNGLMQGLGGGQFMPNGVHSCAMIAQVFYNLEGKPVAGSGAFSDVEAGQWYANAVNWAAANDIVEGYGNGNFGPKDDITREQMAQILYNYAVFKDYDVSTQGDLSTFNDGAKTSDWALPAMQWAVGTGLMQGYDGNLNPTGTATRAEVAEMLMNFCLKILKK